MKNYTKEQVLEAIKKCGDYSYCSVAKYLSQFSENGKCTDRTAKKYILMFEDTKQEFENQRIILIDLALKNIIERLKKNDVDLSKWVLDLFEFSKQKQKQKLNQKFNINFLEKKC